MTLLDNFKTNYKFDIEDKIYVTLPPIYKLFVSVYDVPSVIDLHYNFFSKTHGKVVNFGEIVLGIGVNFYINNFIEIGKIEETLLNLYPNGHEDSEFVYTDGLLPIAGCTPNNTLLLGIHEYNLDKIFYEDFDEPKKYRFIADNIFELLCKINIRPELINGLESYDAIYKNFNEDFYRIREKGSPTELLENKDKEIENLKSEKDKLYYRLKKLAREEKKSGVSLQLVSDKYGFSVDELEKSFF